MIAWDGWFVSYMVYNFKKMGEHLYGRLLEWIWYINKPALDK